MLYEEHAFPRDSFAKFVSATQIFCTTNFLFPDFSLLLFLFDSSITIMMNAKMMVIGLEEKRT